jgi:hypothetical protein
MNPSPSPRGDSAGSPRFGFESPVRAMRARGLVPRIVEDERLDGRIVTLDGRAVVAVFPPCPRGGLRSASCSPNHHTRDEVYVVVEALAAGLALMQAT